MDRTNDHSQMIDTDVASASAFRSPEQRTLNVTDSTWPDMPAVPHNLQVGGLGLDTDAYIIINEGGGVGDGSIEVGVGVETGSYFWNKTTTLPWVPLLAHLVLLVRHQLRGCLILVRSRQPTKCGGGTLSLLMLQMLPPCGGYASHDNDRDCSGSACPTPSRSRTQSSEEYHNPCASCLRCRRSRYGWRKPR